MKRIMNLLVNIGLGIFLLWSGALAAAYFVLLYEKMVRPQYKNMNTNQAFYFGVVAVVFVVLDVLIVKRFIRQAKGKP